MIHSPNESEGGASESEISSDQSQAAAQTPDEAHSAKPLGNSGNITATLANAGSTLEGAEVELVLNPLRLAFETKNLKIMEPALDCLHVC